MIELLVTLSVWVGSYDDGQVKSREIVVKTHHSSCEAAKPEVYNDYYRDYLIDGNFDSLRVECQFVTL